MYIIQRPLVVEEDSRRLVTERGTRRPVPANHAGSRQGKKNQYRKERPVKPTRKHHPPSAFLFFFLSYISLLCYSLYTIQKKLSSHEAFALSKFTSSDAPQTSSGRRLDISTTSLDITRRKYNIKCEGIFFK